MYLCASGIDVTSFYDFSIRYEMFLQYGIVVLMLSLYKWAIKF